MRTIEHRVAASAPRRGQRGFNLIEVIVFIVIVSVALVGVLSVFNVTIRHSADPLIRKQMQALAEALMEEVLLRPFTYCNGSDTRLKLATEARVSATGCTTKVQGFGYDVDAATRDRFNNLTNYCAISPSNSTSCPAMVLGSVGSASSQIPDVSGIGVTPEGYWAVVMLTPEALNGIGSSAPASATDATGLNVIRVTIVVGSVHSDEEIRLDSYRTRWAGNIL